MPERPLECGHCKKIVKVSFKEIVGDAISCTQMCSDCPVLQQKLHGEPSPIDPMTGQKAGASLVCENCRTSLETVKTGNLLGCSLCYTIFADVLMAGFIETSQIPEQLQKTISTTKIQQIHIGKSPNKPFAPLPSSQLTSLNEALHEAVKRENYEQAALLRDQIKALMEKPHDGKS